MDAQIYRTRAAKALAALDTATGYHQTAHATMRGALRASAIDDALTLSGQAGARVSAIGAALAEIQGNEAAASFAEALALRGDPDAPVDLDDWLRETLEGAGGACGRLPVGACWWATIAPRNVKARIARALSLGEAFRLVSRT
ncbi:copper resistance protein CopV [Cupriavidus sp. CP313]